MGKFLLSPNILYLHISEHKYKHMETFYTVDNNNVCYRACHTTRGPYFGEEDGCDYHFVQDEEFQNMICMVCNIEIDSK